MAEPTPDAGGASVADRADILAHYIRHGIGTADDLRSAAFAVAGEPWIDRAVCVGHESPFDLLAAVFFDEAPDVVCVGPRGGWKTQTLAMLNVLEMLAKPGITIAHVASIREQAERGLAYTRAHLASPPLVALGVHLSTAATENRIALGNGSRVEILSGTTAGLSSPRTQRVRVDETELLKPEYLEELRMIPHSFGGWPRQIAYVSSRRERHGVMDDLLNAPRYRHYRRITFCFADVAERCRRERRGAEQAVVAVPNPLDPDLEDVTFTGWTGCLSCDLAPACLGRLARSRGRMRIDDLIAEYRSVSPQAWAAQMGCQRPEVSGRAFRFSRLRNVQEVGYLPHLPVGVSVDFGGGEAATAALFFQAIPRGPIHVLAEYHRIGASIHEDVTGVERIADEMFPDARWGPCTGDSQQPLLISEWNGMLSRFRLAPAKKLARKVEMVSALSALVGSASGGVRWIVHPRCANHIREMESYRALDAGTAARGQKSRRMFTDDTIDAACYIAVSARHGSPFVRGLWGGERREEAGSSPVLVEDPAGGTLNLNAGELAARVYRAALDRLTGGE